MRHFLYFLFTGSLLTFSNLVDAGQALNLAMGMDWKPYVYADEHGLPSGEDLDLLKGVLGQLGYSLHTEDLPEQRMALEIQNGQIDVILGAAFTNARKASYYYSVPYRKETIVFGFRRTRHPHFLDMKVASLLERNYLVAVNNSGWFGQEFQQLTATENNSNFIHAEGTERRMQLLEMGRVDAVVGDRKVLMAAAQDLGISDFEVSKQVIHETDVHFIFSREKVDETFMIKFNNALKATLGRY